jgi:hypothetical protein
VNSNWWIRIDDFRFTTKSILHKLSSTNLNLESNRVENALELCCGRSPFQGRLKPTNPIRIEKARFQINIGEFGTSSPFIHAVKIETPNSIQVNNQRSQTKIKDLEQSTLMLRLETESSKPNFVPKFTIRIRDMTEANEMCGSHSRIPVVEACCPLAARAFSWAVHMKLWFQMHIYGEVRFASRVQIKIFWGLGLDKNKKSEVSNPKCKTFGIQDSKP